MGNQVATSALTQQWLDRQAKHDLRRFRIPIPPPHLTSTTTTRKPTTTRRTTFKPRKTPTTTSKPALSCRPFPQINSTAPLFLCLNMGNTLFSPTANVQAQLDTQLSAEVEGQIDDAFNEFGFHFFKVGENAALGFGLLIVFACLVITLLGCVFFRCKKTAIKHLSVRNAMSSLAASMPSFPSPFSLCGSRASSSASSSVLPFGVRSMPALRTANTSYYTPPQFELFPPLHQQGVYHSPQPASAAPLLMPAPPATVCSPVTPPAYAAPKMVSPMPYGV